MSTEAAYTVQTELFPVPALKFYSRFNLGLFDPENNAQDKKDQATYYNAARGGGQGDYREGLQQKISNVVSALTQFPHSKRAVLTIPCTTHTSVESDHTVTDWAKCLRELHFYLDSNGRLSCTGFMRAQAASIFPKNIHFIGKLHCLLLVVVAILSGVAFMLQAFLLSSLTGLMSLFVVRSVLCVSRVHDASGGERAELDGWLVHSFCDHTRE